LGDVEALRWGEKSVAWDMGERIKREKYYNSPRAVECRNCAERLGYDVGAWRLCPSCRLAYGKGAFWGGLLVAVVVGIFKWLIL
jgi:hypothetical protein